MNMRFKKIVAGIVSAAMLLSSLAALAEDDTQVSFEGVDTYLNLDTSNSDEQIGVFAATSTAKVKPSQDGEYYYDGASKTLYIYNADNTSSTSGSEKSLGWYKYAVDLANPSRVGTSYETLSDTIVIISEAAEHIVIEDGVTEIGNYVFQNFNTRFPNVKSISLPNTLTTIGTDAFQGVNFVDLGADMNAFSGITNIGNYGFADCVFGDVQFNSLKTVGEQGLSADFDSISFSENLTSLGNYALSGSSIGSGTIRFPNSLTSFPYGGLKGAAVENVYLGNSISYIYAYAFNNSSIKNLYMYNRTVTILDYAATNSTLTDIWYFGTKSDKESNVDIHNTHISGNNSMLVNDVTWHYIDDTDSCFKVDDIPAQRYTGNAITPTASVSCVWQNEDGSTTDVALTEGVDYTVAYANNINAGTATLTVTGMGYYYGAITKTFTIAARAITSATVSSIASQAYTGTAITPAVTVTYDGMTLIKDTDYTLSYSNNTSVGAASIVITGIGNYKSSRTISFIIYSTSNGTVEGPSDVRYNWGYAPSSNMQDLITLTAPDGTVFEGETEIGGVSTYLSDDEYFSSDDEEFWGTVNDIGCINADAGKYILWVVSSFNTDNINTGHGFSADYVQSKNLLIWSAKILPITFTGVGYMITDIGEMERGSLPSVTYTGSAITPKITEMGYSYDVICDMSDFVVSYENNINVGTASIVFDATGINVEGSAEVYFDIEPLDINAATISSIASQTCTGSAITPAVTATYNGNTLVSGTDYTVSYSNNTNVGTATVTITGKGNYTGTTTTTFEIVGINISGATVTFPEDITYQGEPCCPEPAVVVNGKTLVKGTDYTIAYSNNNSVGTGTATITGIGSYIGSVSAEFEINPFDPGKHSPIDMSLINVSAIDNCTYDGTAHTPMPTLTYNLTDDYVYTLIEGEDYTVTYENNINTGTAKIILTGIQQGEGGFEGTKNVYFNIAPCELSATTIADIPSYEYCKVDICPEPEIKIGDVVLTKDVDYTLSYENNHNRGTATVTITGTGNLTGTVTKNFEITPRDGTKFVIIVWL